MKDDAAARRQQVLDLRATGMTWEAIARAMGISSTRVKQLHRNALRNRAYYHLRVDA